MKNKVILIVFLVSFSLVFNAKVFASTYDYLPGGDNYLNPDQFELVDDEYRSINPFIVQPSTSYILTVEDNYVRMFERDGEVAYINFYHDEQLISGIAVLFEEFVYEMSTNTDSFIFTSPVSANYLSITFIDLEDYFSNNHFQNIILEKGTIFDGFEDYQKGSLVDTKGPVFTANNVIISYIHSPMSLQDIKSSITAYDAVDGDVSSSIQVISDEYTANINKLGEYHIVFGVSDSSNNQSTVMVKVKIVDIIAPVFTEIDDITVPHSQPITAEYVKNLLSASDNVDENMTEQIELVEDTYSASSGIVGEYHMVFSVQDASLNSTEYEVKIFVVDQKAPIISGDQHIIMGYEESITLNQIKEKLSASDDYDQNLEIKISQDELTGHLHEVGTYKVVFYAEDSSHNKTEYEVTIQIVDDIGPIIYFDYSVIETYTNHFLTTEDLARIVSLDSSLNNQKFQYEILFDSYTKNASKTGTYHVKFKVNNNDVEFEKTIEIKVKEATILEYEPIQKRTDNLNRYVFIGLGGILLIGSNLFWVIKFRRR